MVTKLYDPRTSGAALTEPVSDWDQYLNMNICTAMEQNARSRAKEKCVVQMWSGKL